MKKLLFLFVAICFVSGPLYGYGLFQSRKTFLHDSEERAYIKKLYGVYDPWYSGSLLAPSAHTEPFAEVNIQPYFFWTREYGIYDRKWRKKRVKSTLVMQWENITQVGLTNFMSITVVNQMIYRRKRNHESVNYGDTTVGLGFQLLEGIVHSVVPAARFDAAMSFPTGRFSDLNPDKEGIDAMGSGMYQTNLTLALQKNIMSFYDTFGKINPHHYHPLQLRLSGSFGIPTSVKVNGANAYGGGRAAKGTVHPGGTFTTIFAWEFVLTQHWVIAVDWQYTVARETTFKGEDAGVPIAAPASQQWSVAPAIEFNLNQNFGALIGGWFSFAGRNTNDFVSMVTTFTWNF